MPQLEDRPSSQTMLAIAPSEFTPGEFTPDEFTPSEFERVAATPLSDLVRTPLFERLLIAGGAFGLGSVALAGTALAIGSRFNYLTVETGVINASVTELQSPLDGTITTITVKPGQPVKPGDLLAKVKPIAVEDTIGLKLQGEIDLLTTEKAQIRQTQALLQSQLLALDQQDTQLANQQNQIELQQRSINATKVNAAKVDLDRQRAMIASAIAKSRAAKVEYERYATLATAGVIAQQKLTQMIAVWEAAEAEVQQTKAALKSAEIQIRTLQQESPKPIYKTTDEQRLTLKRHLQEQQNKDRSLTTAITTKTKQLKTQRSQMKARSQPKAVKATSAGIIHHTMETVGGQVKRATPMISILDCRSRWVEALIPAKDADRINPAKPVQIMVPGQSKPLMGRIESMTGMNPEEIKRLPQAITPITPNRLSAQIPTRLVVEVEHLPESLNTQKMCGVGQGVTLTFATQNGR
jgi:multidrug resistance efflux pump